MSDDVRSCSRCDLPMTLQPFHEGTESMCWYCPCCRSRLQTTEMLQAEFNRTCIERGMTADELEAAYRSIIKTDPPSAATMKQAETFAARMAEEWVPACEHDTTNPWTDAA